MKIKRFLSLLLLLCLLASAAAPEALALEEPDIPAKAAILVDLDSGRTLYEKESRAPRAPASLTKVMTALLAYEAIENGEAALSDRVTAQDDCRQGMDESSSTVGIKPGMTLSLEELLYCAMLSSANEACNVIAAHIAGSVDAFVERMNDKASELGCENTHFVNTNGLPAEGHVSSAYDLYLITNAALQYPAFLDLCNTKRYIPSLRELNNGGDLINSNALLTASGQYGSGYVYEYASGVKTGYTDKAGYCLISTAEKDGARLLAVVLGCDGLLNAGIKEYRNFEASIDLYEWAFGNFSRQTLLTPAEVQATVPVRNARGKAEAALVTQQEFRALLPLGCDPAMVQRTVTVTAEKLTAPLEVGETLGELTLSCDGQILGTVPLVCAGPVELSRTAFLGQRAKDAFESPWAVTALAAAVVLVLFLAVRARRRTARRTRDRRPSHLAGGARPGTYARAQKRAGSSIRRRPPQSRRPRL